MKETNYSLIITDLEKRILIQGLTLLKNKQINEIRNMILLMI